MTLPKLKELRLDNGFGALLVERHNLPVVASMVWYRVGSRDEQTRETGLSHFLEHMMFKGTDRYAKGEIDLLTSKMGGSNNAFTDNDNTAYYFSLASDRWETALEIEASRMRGCLLDESEFAAERSVVLEELAMGEDDPWRSLFVGVESLAYQLHPYHNPVIGYREELERVSCAQMRAYYDRNYGPNRSFLVAVGDIDVGRTSARIQELFGGIESVSERVPVLTEPALTADRRGGIRAPGDISRIAMACRTCRMGERDDFSLDVLSHVLGSGKSSRLYRRLVAKEELATHVSTSNETRADPGLFWVFVELRPGADLARTEAAVREELDILLESGVTGAEHRRARVQIRSSYLFEDETVLDTAMKIGRFEASAAGGYRLLRDVLPIYDEMDRREIRRAAGRYFAPGSWTIVWSEPAGVPARRVRKKRSRRKVAAKESPRSRSARKRAAKSGARRVRDRS